MDVFWYVFGFAAHAVFAGAFVVQWLASEKRKRSHVPISFWYIRIVGTVMLFAFSTMLWMEGSEKSIVFMFGFSVNTFIYVRNLVLIYRRRAAFASAVGGKSADTNADAC